jgi:hypothetical protein
MRHIRSHLTFANAVSVIALFVALGGSAAAVMMITSNSQVGQGVISGHKPPTGKHPNIISGSLGGQDLANGAVTPGKLNTPATFTSPNLPQFNLNTGCPPNTNSWALTDPRSDIPVGYYRDASGIVYVRGSVKTCGTPQGPVLFDLPGGYQPATRSTFVVVDSQSGVTTVTIRAGDGAVNFNEVSGPDQVSLNGIFFRCRASGQNGCP